MGIEVRINRLANTHFPPNLSVSIPAGNRNREPVNTGMPSNHPISTGPQLKTRFSDKKVTRTPFNIHAAKQTENASVLKKRTRCALDVSWASMMASLCFAKREFSHRSGDV